MTEERILPMGLHRRHPYGLAVGAVALGCGILLLFLLALWTNLDHWIDERERRAAVISRLVEGGVTRTLESVEMAMAAIGEDARAALDGQASLTAPRQRMAEALRFAPHIRQIAVMHGDTLLLDSRRGGGGGIDLEALQLAPMRRSVLSLGLRLGQPLAGRYLPTVGELIPSNQHLSILPAALMIGEGDNRITVVAALNADYFLGLLRQVELGEHGHLLLVRLDGAPMALQPGDRSSGSFPYVTEAADRGLEEGLVQGKGLRPFTEAAGFRLSTRYPVAVVATVSHRDSLGLWVAENRQILSLSLVLTVALVVGGVLLFREASRRLLFQQQARLLSQAVEQSATSVMITDADGLLTYVNPAFTTVTGYERDQALGRNPRFLKSGLTGREEYLRLWNSLRAGQTWSGEFHNRRRDGELIWELATISPLRDSQDRVTHFICTKLDITARKLADEERERLIAQLNRANAELTRFAEVSALHLQEPVRRLVAMSEKLRVVLPDHVLDGEVGHTLDALEEGGKRLGGLFADIQLYLAAGEPAEAVQPIELAKVAADVLRRRAAQIAEIGAVVELTPMPAVMVDRPRLFSLLDALVDNAIRYRSPQRPLRLSLSATPEGGMVCLRVTDNGVGLAPENRTRAFRTFERISTETYGTGIGLAVVRRIAESGGGRAWIEDGIDGGCSVVVELAAAPNEGHSADRLGSPAEA